MKPPYVPGIFPALALSRMKRRRLAKVRLMRADRAIAKRVNRASRRTKEMSQDFQLYRRTQVVEMRLYRPGEPLEGISISEVDKAGGSPKAGDMVARNPHNHKVQWLVAATHVAANFELELDPRHNEPV